jgi:hypothetical protein
VNAIDLACDTQHVAGRYRAHASVGSFLGSASLLHCCGMAVSLLQVHAKREMIRVHGTLKLLAVVIPSLHPARVNKLMAACFMSSRPNEAPN